MKKIISLIISTVIFISAMSTGMCAFAASASGKCGDNATYTYNDGTLTISGSGPMYNAEYDAATYINWDWVENALEVNNVVINKGITAIGAYAFEALNISGQVTIPDGVTSIGLGAFTYNTGLTAVSIPASVTNIGMGAFYECPLTDVYYGGTAEQWNKINFGTENDNIYSAEVHITATSTAQTQTPQQVTTPTPTAPVANTSNEIKVIVNGTTLSFDQPPVISNGRTLVPMRAILEALGATVEWDANSKSVMATRGNTAALLTVGNSIMRYGSVGGSAIDETLDAPPEIINGRTMIPARAIAEAFSCQVGWDAASRTVTITN